MTNQFAVFKETGHEYKLNGDETVTVRIDGRELLFDEDLFDSLEVCKFQILSDSSRINFVVRAHHINKRNWCSVTRMIFRDECIQGKYLEHKNGDIFDFRKDNLILRPRNPYLECKKASYVAFRSDYNSYYGVVSRHGKNKTFIGPNNPIDEYGERIAYFMSAIFSHFVKVRILNEKSSIDRIIRSVNRKFKTRTRKIQYNQWIAIAKKQFDNKYGHLVK